ncbi:MAG TPA: Mur ligase family protein [Thermoanaerobaculia bacterium]|nr:Mur ligase family protein [Thermoanaerobaculia bacterium]
MAWLRAAATVWRRLLTRTTFVAVGGSVGKSTTKEVLAAILSAHASTAKSRGNANSLASGNLSRTLLQVRPWHRYAVVEIGIGAPGQMAPSARLVRPDVVVMLAVKRCHTNELQDVDGVAREKAALVRALPPDGVAVLNGDDPRVAAMAAGGRLRALRFGTDPACDLWADEVSAQWPDRLSFRVHADGQSHPVRTRFAGTHWLTAFLAAFTAARACGVPLAEAAARAEAVEPVWARTQPITLPNGATVIRDDFNGSIDTFEPALRLLGEARARRRILVASDYSDSNRSPRQRARRLGQEAARLADVAVFVGERAERGVKGAVDEGMAPANAHAFHHLAEATGFLRRELGEGDLVLIKGQGNHHLSRIYLGLIGEVTCRRTSCPKTILCDRCDELGLRWTPARRELMAPPDSRL